MDKVFDMIETEYKMQQTQNSNENPAITNNIQNTSNTESLVKNNLMENVPQLIEKKKKNVGNDENGDIGIANNETEESPKKKKKKNKLIAVNSEIEIKSEENIEQPEKKKKKKKQQENNTVIEENLEIPETSTLQVQTNSDKKSKKKKTKSNIGFNGICENGATKTEKNYVTNEENGILHEKTESQMSKKEKKEIKKKKKYQDELASVTSGIVEADREPLSKKKKRKLNDNEENEEPQKKILKIGKFCLLRVVIYCC